MIFFRIIDSLRQACETLKIDNLVANMLIENMHEIEIQLYDVKETLAKYVHENEVCNSCLSSISSQNECFGSFERVCFIFGSYFCTI